MNEYGVYILTNQYNTVLYTGVTNNLKRRVSEHKSGQGGVFSSKYRTTKRKRPKHVISSS